MSQKIHPSAVIHESAEFGQNVVIGPNCVVDEGVVVGNDTVLDANVVIGKNVRIGERNQLYSNCAIGRPPQLLGMAADAEYGLLSIGDDNIIREQVTIHPSMHVGESTIIGNKNLLKSFRFNYLALPLAEVIAATVRYTCSLIVLGVLILLLSWLWS